MPALVFFLSSKQDQNQQYSEPAERLGHLCAQQNIHIIYGGCSMGLMGILAKAAISQGGQVTGVMPRTLKDQEPVLTDLKELIWVDNITQRIAKMQALADGIIVLPGGLGTTEELFVLWNEIRLGLIHKPLGILNTQHYFTHLLRFVEHMQQEQFVDAVSATIPIIHHDPDALLASILERVRTVQTEPRP